MQENSLSDLSLANVEALAQSENGNNDKKCHQSTEFDSQKGTCWAGTKYSTYDYKFAKYDCVGGPSSSSGCYRGILASGNTCNMKLNDTPLSKICN